MGIGKKIPSVKLIDTSIKISIKRYMYRSRLIHFKQQKYRHKVPFIELTDLPWFFSEFVTLR
jgi:hypothetical protein